MSARSSSAYHAALARFPTRVDHTIMYLGSCPVGVMLIHPQTMTRCLMAETWDPRASTPQSVSAVTEPSFLVQGTAQTSICHRSRRRRVSLTQPTAAAAATQYPQSCSGHDVNLSASSCFEPGCPFVHLCYRELLSSFSVAVPWNRVRTWPHPTGRSRAC